jgi:hypothetical protein
MTPMLLQYLVGLCCLRATPDAVDVIVGDMILDSAADKERDVDITVKINETSGAVYAFKAYEVKKEKMPLDVTVIEELSMKLIDMEDVTHRAIVSASGFTKAAKKKAARHGVDLYTIRPCSRDVPGQFPELEKKGLAPNQILVKKVLLCWDENVELRLTITNPPNHFSIDGSDRVFSVDGHTHKKYSKFFEYRHELLLRSTEILVKLEPALSKAQALNILDTTDTPELKEMSSWWHAHTLDVVNDGIFTSISGNLCQLTEVTLNGFLQLKNDADGTSYYAMERVSDGDIFAGAIVSMGIRPGAMQALVVSPGSTTLGVHIIALEERHLNAIRRLRIDDPR